MQKKIEQATLLVKLPLTSELQIEQTRLGFRFSDPDQMTVVYQGFFNKNKISEFLGRLSIDVR